MRLAGGIGIWNCLHLPRNYGLPAMFAKLHAHSGQQLHTKADAEERLAGAANSLTQVSSLRSVNACIPAANAPTPGSTSRGAAKSACGLSKTSTDAPQYSNARHTLSRLPMP